MDSRIVKRFHKVGRRTLIPVVAKGSRVQQMRVQALERLRSTITPTGTGWDPSRDFLGFSVPDQRC